MSHVIESSHRSYSGDFQKAEFLENCKVHIFISLHYKIPAQNEKLAQVHVSNFCSSYSEPLITAITHYKCPPATIRHAPSPSFSGSAILGLVCSRARHSRARPFSGSVILGLGHSRARSFSGSVILGLGYSRARSFSGSVILGLGHSRARLFPMSKIVETVIDIDFRHRE